MDYQRETKAYLGSRYHFLIKLKINPFSTAGPNPTYSTTEDAVNILNNNISVINLLEHFKA